jgi:hypothetical protein
MPPERLPNGLVRRVEASLRGDSIAVALYGSQAQGAAGPGSDIDVLQLTPARPRSYSDGPVNVTAYTPSGLLEMAGRGSLFVLHLCNDAVIIRDPDGVLACALAAYRSPQSYGPLFSELRAAATALHEVEDSRRYLASLKRLGVYLLRTSMYAKLAERGDPVFVVSEAVDRLGCPRLGDALRLRQKPTADLHDLRTLLETVEGLIGPVPANGCGSVEAFAVSLAGVKPYAADLLAQVLVGEDAGLQYTALMPPFLL